MSRRKQEGLFEDLTEIFMRLPIWVPIAVAGILALLWRTLPLPIERTVSGLSCVVVLITGTIGAIRKLYRRSLISNTRTLQQLREMSWRDFEKLAGQMYREDAWSVTEHGGSGPDGGIDLSLRRGEEYILVQCKQWRSRPVGVKIVREMFGVMHHKGANRVKIITCGDFTPEARGFAVGKLIDLIDGPALLELLRRTPVTSATGNQPAPSSNVQCPLCGSAMVLRTAKHGAHAGEPFYGCSTYPRCRGLVSTPDSPRG
jgi:restriction system protein